MKYVMFRIEQGYGNERIIRHVPIIFPDNMVHKDVADRIARSVMGGFNGPAHPVSAGEITLGEISCHGHSETLGLKSAGERDARVIELFDYVHGVMPDG